LRSGFSSIDHKLSCRGIKGAAAKRDRLMKSNNTSFTTSFGKKIEFVPGYLEYMEKTIGLPKKASDDYVHASQNAVGGHDNLNFEAVNERFKDTRTKISLRGYASRLGRFYQFHSLMSNTWAKYPFKRALDIGCGYGIQPRIMKAMGVAEHITGIDVYDRCTSIDEANLKKQHRRLPLLKGLEWIQSRIEATPPDARSDLQRAIMEKTRNPRQQMKDGIGWKPDTGYYGLKYVNEPKLDRYIVGDVYNLEEKFDLITTYTSFEWFEAASILKKVSDMLNPGGIFYIWVSNWWSDVNVTRSTGHFPYACQRLTKDDYFRYLDECLPEYAEAMKASYVWFDPSHPTLADYLDIGYANGMVPLEYKDYGRPKAFDDQIGISPLGQVMLNGSVLDETLEDIHQFRPDVRITDLFPFTHAIVFQKVDKSTKLGPEALHEADREIDFHYRPSNPIMRKARELAVKLYIGK
jgi:SAM-dependent methyltransferase